MDICSYMEESIDSILKEIGWDKNPKIKGLRNHKIPESRKILFEQIKNLFEDKVDDLKVIKEIDSYVESNIESLLLKNNDSIKDLTGYLSVEGDRFYLSPNNYPFSYVRVCKYLNKFNIDFHTFF